MGLAGLLLYFLGIVGPLWPIVVAGLYLIGVLVTPWPKAIDLTSTFDPEDIRDALEKEVKVVSDKVPPEVLAKVRSIADIITGILPRSGSLPPGSPELFIVQRTALDYLPTALQTYINLPRAYATLHPLQGGKTAKQVLLDQLTLLESKLSEVADDVNKNDTDRFLAHGRFLQDKFGGSPLSLDAPAASSR